MTLSEEDLKLLADRSGVEGEQIEAVSDEECPLCGATISETRTMGEVGHQRGCPRREEKYNGRRGRRELGGGRELAHD